jgi:hypothetical protein
MHLTVWQLPAPSRPDGDTGPAAVAGALGSDNRVSARGASLGAVDE